MIFIVFSDEKGYDFVVLVLDLFFDVGCILFRCIIFWDIIFKFYK